MQIYGRRIREYHTGLRIIKEVCDSIDQQFGKISAELEQLPWVKNSKLRKQSRQLNQAASTTNLNRIDASFFWD